MKKKILCVIAALLLFVTLSFGLAACNKKNPAASIKGEEVSEKTWDDFFNNFDKLDNWKLEITEKSSGVQSDSKFVMETKTTVVYDNGKSHVTVKYNISGDSINSQIAKVRYTDTEYYRDVDGKYYHADGKPVTDDEKKIPGADYDSALNYADFVPSTTYLRYKYSKEYKGYVYIAGTNNFVVLKFVDGKLAAAYSETKTYNTQYNNSESTDSYIFTYGKQSVIIP